MKKKLSQTSFAVWHTQGKMKPFEKKTAGNKETFIKNRIIYAQIE